MLRTILKPLSFVPALLLMYMIFSFSAQEGDVSAQLSYKVSVKIVETADYIFDANLDYYQIDEWANKINFITRKLAHMAEYFALAVAVSFPLYVYGLHGILLMLIAGLICIGFACGDEYHQSFVMGRSPSVKDVCIDSVGVFLGIIVVRIIGWTGRKTIFRPKKVKKVKKKKFKVSGRDSEYAEPPYEMPPQNGGYYQVPPQNGGYPFPPQSGNYQYPPQNGGYRYPPQSGNYQYPPQSGNYQVPPRQDGYYQAPQDSRYYQPQNDMRQGPSQEDSYFRPPNDLASHQNLSGQEKQGKTQRQENPMDPYWQPEKEIDFNLKPEYPEREYLDDNDPYDNDWGFDEPKKPDFEQTAVPPYIPPQETPPQHPNVPEPSVRKKKKHKKDWFFDM